MPSFDIVSEVDMEEIRNAAQNTERELASRFDFRGTNATIEFKDKTVVFKAEGEFQLQQLESMFRNACSKRKLDTGILDVKEYDQRGKTCTQVIAFKEGIETDIAKKIVKLVKDQKIKVQTAIQGDQLRVTGKKKDDLQAVMSLVKQAGLGQPFQFKNFKD